MISVRLSELAAIVGAQGDAPTADAVVTGVATDSRKVAPGDVFIAFAGERVDGTTFVADALAAGAVAAVTTSTGAGMLTVDDPLVALQQIAADQRRRSSATVVAITGSAGKTLTKDFTVAALGAALRVASTAGNQNNELGVPLTLCALRTDTEVVVVEVGARGIGHIASLMPMVRPDISVVLNVGRAHVGEFGGIEQTATAKGELVQSLSASGTAILNADDPRTRLMAAGVSNVVLFGEADDATIQIVSVELDDVARATMTVQTPTGRVSAKLPLPGAHLTSNAAAALAVVSVLGLDLEKAAAAIENATLTPGRMRLREAGRRLIIDDTYNASPDSMTAGLKTLAAVSGRTRIAVLGFMAELGDETLEQHDRIGRLVTRLGIDRLLVVGDDAAAMLQAARHEGMSPADASGVPDIEAAVAALGEMADDAVVLVKASRSQRLERVVDALVEGGSA